MLCIATNMSWVRTAWSELHHPNLIVKAPPTLLGGVKFLPSYLKPHKFLTFLLYHASLAHPENCRSRLAAFLQFWGGGEADLNERWHSAYLKQLRLVLLCVVTLLGRKRGHWLTKPAENEDPAWQQERLLEIPQNLCMRVCRGKRKGIVHFSVIHTQRVTLRVSKKATREFSFDMLAVLSKVKALPEEGFEWEFVWDKILDSIYLCMRRLETRTVTRSRGRASEVLGRNLAHLKLNK